MTDRTTMRGKSATTTSLQHDDWDNKYTYRERERERECRIEQNRSDNSNRTRASKKRHIDDG